MNIGYARTSTVEQEAHLRCQLKVASCTTQDLLADDEAVVAFNIGEKAQLQIGPGTTNVTSTCNGAFDQTAQAEELRGPGRRYRSAAKGEVDPKHPSPASKGSHESISKIC